MKKLWVGAFAVVMASAAAVRAEPKQVAVAIVMEGSEIWIGNDKLPAKTLPKDDASRMAGILVDLEAAIDATDLAHAGPKGSVGAIYEYREKTIVHVPFGPLEKLKGAALGKQDDYFKVIGRELERTIDVAVGDLEKTKAPIQVLIVLGDGDDINNETAKGALVEMKKRLAKGNIHAYSIVYEPPGYESNMPKIIDQLVPSIVIKKPAEVRPALAKIVGEIRGLTGVPAKQK